MWPFSCFMLSWSYRPWWCHGAMIGIFLPNIHCIMGFVDVRICAPLWKCHHEPWELAGFTPDKVDIKQWLMVLWLTFIQPRILWPWDQRLYILDRTWWTQPSGIITTTGVALWKMLSPGMKILAVTDPCLECDWPIREDFGCVPCLTTIDLTSICGQPLKLCQKSCMPHLF